jgi:hypothetical protein
MSMPSEFDVVALNRDISQLETESARWTIERAAAAKLVRQLGRRIRYLQAAALLRKAVGTSSIAQLALLAIGPLVAGVAGLIVSSLLVSSWTLAALVFFVAGTVAFIVLMSLLYRPSIEQLPSALADAASKHAAESARLREAQDAKSEVERRLAVLHGQRGATAKSDKLQRAMLLQRNWKSLRGSEWEDYVVEVCRTLGANVQRGEATNAAAVEAEAPAKGPRGVMRRATTTLFITFSPRRLAVAAVSEVNPFHAAAVRQVIDDLAKQGCEEMGILTNARITAGSKEYAHSRRCTLIGEEEFPDFVLGNTPL